MGLSKKDKDELNDMTPYLPTWCGECNKQKKLYYYFRLTELVPYGKRKIKYIRGAAGPDDLLCLSCCKKKRKKEQFYINNIMREDK